jgi:hypothetical protein
MNESSEAGHDLALQTRLVEQYLGLEAMEVIEDLLDLCGATIDARALPKLKQRLTEEEACIPVFQDRGYVRMREKSEQLVESLRRLIAILEKTQETWERND